MRVVGRDGGDGPTATLGEYRARDGSTGAAVHLDLDGPHVASVVGKRGAGKSYTLGVLAEALARTDGIAPVVADPMGVFGSLAAADTDDTDVALRSPDDGAVASESTTATPQVVSADVITPRVPASALDPRSWCRVLDLDPASAPGTLVWQAAERADSLADMQAFVADADATASTRRAAANHLSLADSWDVFECRSGASDDDQGPTQTADRRTLGSDAVTVLDLAGLDRAPANAVIAAVSRQLYDARVDGTLERLPWLLVDEAHVFFEGIAGPSLRTLLTRGRQPGVSLVTATQRPSALPDVAVSQSDLLVVHRLTSRADRDALAAARPTFMDETFAERMPTAPGEAVIVDDATESIHAVRIRERWTPHGGDSPSVSATRTGKS